MWGRPRKAGAPRAAERRTPLRGTGYGQPHAREARTLSGQGKERHHVIEPKPLRFKDGHVYLHGWSLDRDKELRFRLDYQGVRVNAVERD